MAKQRLLVLCSSARTGSSLICDYLLGGGIITSELWVFGKPKFIPHLTAPQIAKHLNKPNDSGVRGINPIIHHLHSKNDNPNPAEWLWKVIAEFGVERTIWFYLSRYDVVRQAISYERAMHLGEWLTFGTPGSADKMPYDPKQIANRISNINYQHDWWTAFFNHHNINPTRLFYEDLAADIPGTMNKIFKIVGAGEFVPDAKHRKKQAHNDVESHIQRYYKELSGWSGLWSPTGKR